MIDEADEDGSGSVNFQEFVQLMLMRQAGGITREEIKQVGFINTLTKVNAISTIQSPTNIEWFIAKTIQSFRDSNLKSKKDKNHC